MEELDHESGKALKRPRDTDRRRNFDEDALGRVYVDLKPPRFVDGRVEQGQQALQGGERSAADSIAAVEN